MKPKLELGKYKTVILTDELEQYLKLKYIDENNSILTISKELGVSDKQVSRLLKESSIGIKSSSDSHKTYSIIDNVFETIDSHEKAYWLGFLYADGYLSTKTNNIGIELKSDDQNHLELFAKFVGSNKQYVNLLVNGKYEHSAITLTNKKMTKDLVRLGCLERKSLTLKFPTEDIVPKEFLGSLILGYFDGDGCISFTKEKGKNNLRVRISFTGTMEFLEGVQTYFNTNKPIKREHRCENNTFSFRYGKSEGIDILDKLYQECPVHLERKYNRFIEAKKSIIRKYSPKLK